ncbi:MAG: PfkB family carbohydrate kinase [Armatimonadota bacterium]|nr:PfkB family carbohydrate kinase [Armatimonadota bacterium]
MDRETLQCILAELPNQTIAVVGDFFLDRYFVIESSLAEKSVETGLTAHQVVDRRLSPGAAGTVVSNLRALGVGRVICISVIGVDGEGFELKRALRRIGADDSHIIESEERFTPCYTKPMLREHGKERELERIDIKNRKILESHLEDEIISRLRSVLPSVDGVVIADQVQERNVGVITDRVREEIARLAREYEDKPFIADSRARIGEYRDVIIKPNKFEAVDAVRGRARLDLGIVEPSSITVAEAKECAVDLSKRTGKPVFLTAQEDGIFVVDGDVVHVPAVLVTGEIDPVGAGDSCTAAIISALCAGSGLVDAALLGNIVASITIQKIGQTGTASPEEVIDRFDWWTSQK